MKHLAAIFLLILCVNFHLHSQSDYTLNYKNSIKVLNQNNDTLKMPFVGGLTAAQFMNIDLNGDGKVNIVDFSILAYWFKRPLTAAAVKQCVDQTQDGKVSLADFSILAYYWTK